MLENINLILKVHALFGSSGLIAFWITALSKKGSKLHITTGRIYLISMCLVLLSTIPIVLHFYFKQDISRTMTLTYLFFVTLSAMIFLFFPIRNKSDIDRYRNIIYKVLAIFMTAYGTFVLYQGLANPVLAKKILLFGFSSIGLVIGISMLQLAWAKTFDKKWWIQQHLNGAMVAFAATHASFLGLGLRKLLPALAGEWMHTGTQVAIILLAYALRIYAGRMLAVRRLS